jgi:FtsH-binding integral membrane protein
MSTRRSGPTSSFPGGGIFVALAFSLGGGALVNTWSSMLQAHLSGRLVAILPWLALALLAALRLRRATRTDSPRRAFSATRAGLAIVPSIFGGMIGFLVALGSTVLLALFAAACLFAPWSRIPLCRRHPGWASLSMCCGGALALAICHDRVDPMFLPVAAWVLGVSALAALVWTMRPQPAPAAALPVRN